MNNQSPIVVSHAEAIFCTWIQLYTALEPLHQGDKADVDRLHDIWLTAGVPAPSYKVALPGARFDERHPRPGDHLTHILPPTALVKWIQDVSARRGFPYSERQSLSIAMGREDYGF